MNPEHAAVIEEFRNTFGTFSTNVSKRPLKSKDIEQFILKALAQAEQRGREELLSDNKESHD